MRTETPPRVELEMEELEAILERARTAALSEQDHAKLKAAVETLGLLTEKIEAKGISIRYLRRLLFGPSTEKMTSVFACESKETQEDDTAAPSDEPADGQPAETPDKKKKPRAKGHGRNGADAYTGADRVSVPHESLRRGGHCPGCLRGRIYKQAEPSTRVRVVGQAPLRATVYELEKLRCNLCGEVFTASAPPEVGEHKYDETAAGMIALLKYGTGLPFHRLERLQAGLGSPLPAATQWGIVAEAADSLKPVYTELIRQAAQGELFHNDDTGMTVLELTGKRRQNHPPEDVPDGRTGVFTTGIVSVSEGRRIPLFFTGPKHAGENLTELLRKRATELAAPMQMCDGLDRNLPKAIETVVGNCTAHARRNFVNIAENFPAPCRQVLETLRHVFHNDDIARQRGLSAEQRLRLHQRDSRPLMAQLKKWMEAQLENKEVEPNSGLGRAINYMLKRWDRLTLFLRVPGAPIHNNIVERALKRAIVFRKNSLFYKTRRGAFVGDLFMSLIYAAELSAVEPFHYLTELLKHAPELSQDPARWMPWNYPDALSPPNRA